MKNALTIDVEDYYMVSAFADVIRFEDWPRYESRVEKNTYQLLDLLDHRGVKATFFVLGWIGERHPGLIKEIRKRGHEIGCHGYNHRLVYDLTPREFQEDTRKAKKILEDITGEAVDGYRATSYSIVERTRWALDILIEEGFRYDSSIFPVRHDRYGIPGAERFPYQIKQSGGSLMEVPPSTVRMWRQNIPVAGGGYLRLYPLLVTRKAIEAINGRERQPAVVYVHPWEIDRDQPRIRCRIRSRFRHYINLHSTLPKLRQLLAHFRFQSMAELAIPKTTHELSLSSRKQSGSALLSGLQSPIPKR